MAFVLIMAACVTYGSIPGDDPVASSVATSPPVRGGPHAACPVGMVVPLGVPGDGRGLRNNARSSLLEGNEDEAEEPRSESIGFLPNDLGASRARDVAARSRRLPIRAASAQRSPILRC